MWCWVTGSKHICRSFHNFRLQNNNQGTLINICQNWFLCDIYNCEFYFLTSLALPQPVSGLHIFPSPRRPRARWASGARSPQAPTEPCSGTHDKHDAEIKIVFCVDQSKSQDDFSITITVHSHICYVYEKVKNTVI